MSNEFIGDEVVSKEQPIERDKKNKPLAVCPEFLKRYHPKWDSFYKTWNIKVAYGAVVMYDPRGLSDFIVTLDKDPDEDDDFVDLISFENFTEEKFHSLIAALS